MTGTDGDHIEIGPSESEEHLLDATELALTRIAGGFVIADDINSTSKDKKRWGVASVDGWVLGMPGPGPDWQPAPGVKLTLEALGSCRACSTPLAVPEYICNSASRPRSASRTQTAGAQKPRVKMVDADTQTDVEYKTSSCQAEILTLEHVEAQIREVERLKRQLAAQEVRAEAVVAGAALATLAAPAPPPLANPSAPELLFSAEPSVARSQVRATLASVARLAGGGSIAARGSHEIAAARPALLSAALKAAQDVEEAAAAAFPGDGDLQEEQDATGSKPRRSLGHRCRAAVPSFLTTPDGRLNSAFQAGATRALASSAVAALRREDGNASGELGCAPVQDAIVNLAALLCTRAEAPTLGEGKIFEVIIATSQLLKPSALPAAVGGRAGISGYLVSEVGTWQQMAARDAWPWVSQGGGASKTSSWPLLRRALTALDVALASTDREAEEDQVVFCEALQALAALALFLDAEDVEREDAEKAAMAPVAPPPDPAGFSTIAPPPLPPGASLIAPPPAPPGSTILPPPLPGGLLIAPPPAAPGFGMAPPLGAGLIAPPAAPPPSDDLNPQGSAMIDALLGKGGAAPMEAPVFGRGSQSSGLGGGLGDPLGGAMGGGLGGVGAGAGGAKSAQDMMQGLFTKKKR